MTRAQGHEHRGREALKALGFEVTADEYYERGTKDFYRG